MKWLKINELNEDLKPYKNEFLMFECELDEFSKRVTKSGNLFGILIVKNGIYQTKFFLFRDDIKRFNHLNKKGKKLIIKGRPKKKRFSNDFEFKITEIHELF